MTTLALTYQIPAAARPHARGVHCTCRNITALTGAISAALAIHRQRHLSVQNDVRGLRKMRVIRIGHVRRVLPHVGMTESLSLKTSRKFPFVHDMILPNIRQLPLENGNALPAALGDTAERARPSSGEKLVYNLQNQKPGGGGSASAGAPIGGVP
jgi:hypothetical protein